MSLNRWKENFRVIDLTAIIQLSYYSLYGESEKARPANAAIQEGLWV